MARDDSKRLSEAKKAHRNAEAVGNRAEEARWANVIGNIYKNLGQYPDALKWLRIDYDISFRCLTRSQCFAACQSLGDTYFLLKDFKHALIYQKKHLDLAKDEDNLIEQQRANTQLGRTYHEMLSHDKDDHNSVRSARKYFKCALELARILKKNPPTNDRSFLREFIDAYNNMGMLEMDLDNYEEAKEYLTKGLEFCAEEEFPEDDASYTRLHHNIGVVYMNLRVWDKAKKHTQKDIKICNRIEHCEGEAKGYINYGVIHYKTQEYKEALDCYKRARNLATAVDGNDSLVEEIDVNIQSAEEAMIIMADLKKKEQNLKKLTREVENATGKPEERRCMLQLNAFLDTLIDAARAIEFWSKVCEFGKRKMAITTKLCDKEKLSESYFILGDAYSSLRKFGEARKWYSKSLEIYESIGNLEEQARTKIEIGSVLDSAGNWQQALEAYEESYRIAVEAKAPSIQLLALENMHYCYLIRFSNDDEARRLQLEINKLKKYKYTELERQGESENCCSETDTEGSIHVSEDRSETHSSPETLASVEEVDDDTTLASLLNCTRGSLKVKPTNKQNEETACTASLSKSASTRRTFGRKRGRVILSDDEDEACFEVEDSRRKTRSSPVEDVGTSDELRDERNLGGPVCMIQDESAVASKSSNLPHIEESSGSYKTTGLNRAAQNGRPLGYARTEEHDCITVKINNELLHVNTSLFAPDAFSVESVNAELACLYYLQLPEEKRSVGLLPKIQHIKCGDRVIESLETIESLKDDAGNVLIEAAVVGWFQHRLIKHYIDGCKELSQMPNMKLLKKLYDLEVSDDEINVSNCELQDLSITPLLNALYAHKTFAMLDLSHNSLGNETMEKLQQVFTSSSQKYGGLTLDLHCNIFGPTALIKICECPSLFSRLEVLNISGNRITDSSASCLSIILKECRALCSLNIEACAITSRTIVKIVDAMNSESVLEHLYIGHNNPITTGNIVNLLHKLTTLKSFSKLSLNGLKLSKPVLDGLCLLAEKSQSFSGLMLGETGIGNESASAVTEALSNHNEDSVKLDLSYCRLTTNYINKLNDGASRISCILELNLAGNPITHKGSRAMASLLLNRQCCLKVLVLEKCELGVYGILQILQALSENASVEDLNLADNAKVDHQHDTSRSSATKGSTEPMTDIPLPSQTVQAREEVSTGQQGLCPVNDDLCQLEVADSEEDCPIRIETSASGIDNSCASSSQRTDWSHENQFVAEIRDSLSKAKALQVLDLSKNGFLAQVAEIFFTSWSSSRRCQAYRHVKDQTIHFLTKGRKCCLKPCCKKDLL